MEKRFRVREISSNWVYSVEEAAEVIGSCTRTIRMWIKHEGLLLFAANKPYGILGSDLKQFVLDRRSSKKSRLAATEFYCFRCKCARGPKNDRVLQVAQLGGASRMVGICEKCGAKINRSIKKADEGIWVALFDVRKDEVKPVT